MSKPGAKIGKCSKATCPQSWRILAFSQRHQARFRGRRSRLRIFKHALDQPDGPTRRVSNNDYSTANAIILLRGIIRCKKHRLQCRNGMSPPREKMPSENKNVDPTVRLLKAIGRRIAGYVTAVQRTSWTIKTSKLVYSLLPIA